MLCCMFSLVRLFFLFYIFHCPDIWDNSPWLNFCTKPALYPCSNSCSARQTINLCEHQKLIRQTKIERRTIRILPTGLCKILTSGPGPEGLFTNYVSNRRAKVWKISKQKNWQRGGDGQDLKMLTNADKVGRGLTQNMTITERRGGGYIC